MIEDRRRPSRWPRGWPGCGRPPSGSAAPLAAEDYVVQSMPDASPAKWHLAHTSWFFETFVLGPHRPGYRPVRPAYGVLFNSYYVGVGARHPRPSAAC